MGAGQSVQEAGSSIVKTSYYALLGIEREATDDEIKKAYRKKALELHPDRNYGKEEEATRLFADIQAAYEILSDPQERAWYDSHEGAILRGFEDGNETGASDPYQYGDIKITTSDDISRFVAGFAMRRVDYDNVPNSFFTELKVLFEKLADEESRAARMEGLANPEFPTFGDKDDSYEDVVKAFYAAWNGFSTSKSYFWADRWNLAEAPDRRYRRAMEKENKKEREDAVREFNDSVRSLIAFVRKRDPRYKPNFQSDSDRQQALREAAQAQAARSRAANAEKTTVNGDAVPEWARARDPDEEDDHESEEEIVEEFECVACHKSFKSEKQFEAHEKSKKHQKAVQSLKRKMQKDNDLLDLGNAEGDGWATPQLDESALDDVPDSPSHIEVEDIQERLSVLSVVDSLEHSQDDAPAVRDRAASTTSSDISIASDQMKQTKSTTLDETPVNHSAEPKIGKAAQKRAKKAAKAAVDDTGTRFSCAQCNASFPSRSRLFQHLKDFGHAAPASSVKTGKPKGKKNR